MQRKSRSLETTTLYSGTVSNNSYVKINASNDHEYNKTGPLSLVISIGEVIDFGSVPIIKVAGLKRGEVFY